MAVTEAKGPNITIDGVTYRLLGLDEKGSKVYQNVEVLKEQEKQAEASAKQGENTPDSAEPKVDDWTGQGQTEGDKTDMQPDATTKDWDFSNMTIEEANDVIYNAVSRLREQAEKMDYPYGLVFGYQANSAKVQAVKDSKLPFGYNHKEDIVYVNPFHSDFAEYDFNEAMLHELAHRYDRTAVGSWTSQSFSDALTKAKDHAISNLDILEQIANRYPTDYYLQDIIGILSDDKIDVFAGHGQLSIEAEAREIFANLASMRARNTETYDVLKSMFSEMIQEFEILFGGE